MRERKIEPLSEEDQVYAKELIRVLNGRIRRTVRVTLGRDLSSEFEDIVQNVYEAICRQLDDFKNCDSQEALAVTIATRAVWTFRRDHKPTEALPEDIPAEEADRGLGELLPTSTTDGDREILNAVYARRDRVADLAADLDCAPGTLRQRLRRAKARLKRTLEENT